MDIQQIHEELYQELLIQLEKNPQLRFRPRKTNRGGKMSDKGYWFLGNDNYLVIGFWKGMNWKTKIPNIMMIFNKEGKAHLMTSTSDSNSKHQFVAKYLGPKFEFWMEDERFVKDYPGMDHVEALRYFLKHEWAVINDVIASNGPLLQEDHLPFGIIEDWEFQEDLENLAKYHKIFHQKTQNQTTKYLGQRLLSVEIKNFYGIEKCKLEAIDPDTQMIFFTGDNGSGKTTILRALAIALCQNSDQGAMDSSDFEIKVELQESDGLKQYVITKDTKKDYRPLLTDGFAAYGPTRLLSDADVFVGNIVKISFSHIKKYNAYGLFNALDVLRSLTDPYDIGERPKYIEMSIQALLENLNEILEVVNTVASYDNENGIRFFEKLEEDEELDFGKSKSFDELSSGTKSFCSLIIDLSLRLKNQQPDVMDISEYTGVVIIDEIDLHLHPRLQREVVFQLCETFPEIQFILSTHSAVSLLGAPKNSVFYAVNRNESGAVSCKKLGIDIHELNPNLILTSPIFGFSEILSKHSDQGLVNAQDSWAEKSTQENRLTALVDKYKKRKSKG